MPLGAGLAITARAPQCGQYWLPRNISAKQEGHDTVYVCYSVGSTHTAPNQTRSYAAARAVEHSVSASGDYTSNRPQKLHLLCFFAPGTSAGSGAGVGRLACGGRCLQGQLSAPWAADRFSFTFSRKCSPLAWQSRMMS